MKNFFTCCILLLVVLVSGNKAIAQSTVSAGKYFRLAEKQYTAKQYPYAIPLYKAAIQENPKQPANLLRLADCYWQMKKMDSALHYYKLYEAKGGKLTDTETQLRYAELLAQNSEYNRAVSILNDVSTGTDGNSQLLQERKKGFMHPEAFKTDSLRYHIQFLNINSSQSDYSPRFFGQGIVYISSRITADRDTREIGWNGNTYSRLYQVKDAALLSGKDTSGHWYQPAYREQDKINDDDTDPTSNDNNTAPRVPVKMAHDRVLGGYPAEPFARALNVDFNNGPVCFNKEENIIYFTRNTQNKKEGVHHLQICSAVLTNGEWGQVKTLAFAKEGYDYFHPALSADGSRLYFCSNQPGGMGGTDIYSIAVTGDAAESMINESALNTAGNELFPTVHGDTLYFSSDGYAGLGGLDIYRVWHEKGTARQPENLGYPLNSSYDDFGMVYAANGTEGLFTSNRLGSDDVYSFSKDPQYLRPAVKDSLQRIARLQREEAQAEAQKNADRMEEQRAAEVARLRQQLRAPGSTSKRSADILSRSVLFETAKDELLPESKRILEKVKTYMDANPAAILMIDGHTDIRAEAAYNLDLSERRAAAVRSWLVSKGIAENRLVTRGYGFTRPAAPNGTTYGRQLNRRVEIKMINQ